MDYALFAFYAFAAAAVMSAVAVISVRNMVQAALFLVLTFSPWPAPGYSPAPSSSASPWYWCTWAR